MRKAVFVVWEFPPGPGGIGQHAFSMTLALSKLEYSIHILTSADYVRDSEIDLFDRNNSELSIRRIKGWVIFKYLRRIWWTLADTFRLQPEEIICSGKSAIWLVPLVQLIPFTSTRVSIFLHGSEVQLPGRLERMITYWGISKADRVFCVSNFTKALMPISLRNKSNVFILPNGLNLDKIEKHVQVDKVKFIGTPSLITVGQLTKRKGQHRVIKSLPYLIERWPELHYHMVGLDTNREELMKLANDLNVENHITFHGRLKERGDVLNAYAACDIFIMLSENQKDGDVEGFGIAILEANYFGRPAIGAKNCGIEDAIQEGTNGYLVDGDNPQEIQLAIDQCLKRRIQMEPTMKQWVNQHDWSQLIQKFSI